MKHLLTLYILTFSYCTSKSTNFQKNEIKKELNIAEMIKVDFFRNSVPDSLKYLLPILDSVYVTEFRFRTVGDNKKFLDNKNEVLKNDKINLAIVCPIIDKYGFLGFQDIGMFGATALFKVIQHSDSSTHIKYREKVRVAFLNKKITSSDYAMFEDRILKSQHKKQMFGTQILISQNASFIYPIYNVDSLEIRRNAIKLNEPYFNYCKRLKFNWNINTYKLYEDSLLKIFRIIN